MGVLRAAGRAPKARVIAAGPAARAPPRAPAPPPVRVKVQTTPTVRQISTKALVVPLGSALGMFVIGTVVLPASLEKFSEEFAALDDQTKLLIVLVVAAVLALLVFGILRGLA